MKKLIIIPLLLLILIITGCTADDPGYSTIVGNPEVKVVDADGDIINIDEATGAIVGIDYSHHEIHESNAYTLTIANHDLDDGITLDLTVITANTTNWMHSVWSAEGTAAIHIYLYEGATTNVAGSATAPFNRDRNSANMPGGTFRDGDTFTDLGTIIWEWHTGDRKVAGGGAERDEYILRQGTQYLLRVESEADNNKVSGQVSWYEHINK